MPQQELLVKHFGCTRYLYNHFLACRKEQYLTTGRNNNFVKDCKELTKLKKAVTWLTEVNSQSLQHAIKNLDAAYGNFYEKRAKFPTFKNKHGKQTFRIPQNVRIKNGKLVVPKFLEGIPMALHRDAQEAISYCTITKNKAGQYHCTLLVEKDIERLLENDKVVGVDLGIKTLVVDSDGGEHENIKPYRTLKKKIKRVQRKLSRKRHKTTDEKSKRIEKVRLRLAKLHQRVKDVRSNHLHQITRKLIDENQVVVVETLAVKNMMKNHRLAGAIADCAWSELLRQLEYKAAWYGRTVVKIDRFFPSSKTCSGCDFIKQNLTLRERLWICPGCGIEHDRDVNAARMIRKQGLVQLRVERPKDKLVDSDITRLNIQTAEVESRNCSF